ncbi:MAG: nucleoside kinase [Anaerolineae bacterium]|nr:nucleoside kinase [Anaerolineae bacterium]
MEAGGEEIRQVEPRKTVEIHLPDGRVFSGPRNIPVGDFFRKFEAANGSPIVGAIINGELRELTYPIQMDARVQPVTMKDADGARIYRRSLTFLLEAAFIKIFKNVHLAVDHSVSSGGYFCEVIGRPQLDARELQLLEEEMHRMVKADLPFEKKVVPLEEAVECFEKSGHLDKVRLMSYRKKPTLVLYGLGEHRDYLHGYMVPSTGYLKWFDLLLVPGGFVLRYPRRHSGTKLLPVPKSSSLFDTFQQYGNWLERLGIENVGSLNDAINESRIREVILISEALHEQKIADIAKKAADRFPETRVVLIAGPSSSGKTTFSKRLAVQLLVQGLAPFPMEMDHYFINRDKTPLGEDGQPDFESLAAMDTALLSDHLARLIRGEEVQLPHYNFKSGQREPGEVVRLEKERVIILEGIHGLNPQLLPEMSPNRTFKVYVSALTQLNLDRQNRISTTDTRLIRRIVRDARERGYTAQQTIQRWESVRRGEKRNIFPYQENADEMFNSALVYELSALKPLAEPLLRQVPYGTAEYIEAKRLLTFLEWFLSLDISLIPDNSILREFIGDSILKDFKLWDHYGKAQR